MLLKMLPGLRSDAGCSALLPIRIGRHPQDQALPSDTAPCLCCPLHAATTWCCPAQS